MKVNINKIQQYPLKNVLADDLLANKIILEEGEAPTFLFIVRKVLWCWIYHPRFMCVFWYRVNRYVHEKKIPGKNLLSAWRMLKFGNDISFYAEIGPGLRIVHLSDIVVGGKVKVGKRVTLLNGVTLGTKGEDSSDMPVVGDGVYIGSGAKIIGPVNIGDNVVVGALTLCNENVPTDHVVYGIPPNQIITRRAL